MEEHVVHGDLDHRIDDANDVCRNHGHRYGHDNDCVYRGRECHTLEARMYLLEAVGVLRMCLYVDTVFPPEMKIPLYARMAVGGDI